MKTTKNEYFKRKRCNIMRKHYSIKLKERIDELERDIYAILDGNLDVLTKYKTLRQLQQETEKILQLGRTRNNGNIIQCTAGIFPLLI